MNFETIFALSSGHGKSGIAIIRISGTELQDYFIKLSAQSNVIARHAYLTNLQDNDGSLIDQCVLIYFPAPHSFTGDDVIEIHCHGSVAVIQKIFNFLRESGARMATPGEFSKRAFYNNKMNLVDVDGLASLLDARTDKQREIALKSMTGNDTKVYENWRNQMIEIAAYAAAILDYPDDELPQNIGEKLTIRAQKLSDDIDHALCGHAGHRAIRNGFNIVLTGDTNVGKSSLFNCLVGGARAIVSDIPGTTRDVISQDLDIDGYLVHISDTAGLRTSDDVIEKIGIERAHETTKNADLVLRVYSSPCQVTGTAGENEIIIINKSDLQCGIIIPPTFIAVSALTGDGIGELIEKIKQKIHNLTDGFESSISVNERTRTLLTDARDNLTHAINLSKDNYDIFAEHVRSASDSIGKILGMIDATDVADATFSSLCLGK